MRSLDKIRATLAAATPGPWEAGLGWVYTDSIYPDDNRLANVLGLKFTDPDRQVAEAARAQRNAEFIAHARTDVEDLVAEVENLRLQLDIKAGYAVGGVRVAPVAEVADGIAELIEAEAESRAEDMDLDDPEIGQLTGLSRAAEIAREYAAKES